MIPTDAISGIVELFRRRGRRLPFFLHRCVILFSVKISIHWTTKAKFMIERQVPGIRVQNGLGKQRT